MDALKAELAQQPMAGVPRQGSIAVEELGGRLVVTDQAVSGASRVREWSTYRDDHLVILQARERRVEAAGPLTRPGRACRRSPAA